MRSNMPRKIDLAVLLLLNLGSFLEVAVGMEEDCVDFFGHAVTHGHFYIPGPSVCTKCVCYHSQALWCKAIYCRPPFFCKNFRVGENCCEFDCLDTPEEIAKEKDRLRNRKRFLGIVYGIKSEAIKLKPQQTSAVLLVCGLLVSAVQIFTQIN